ncbi:hypothetical protein TRVL_08754 [Trypanosoma vivax]|nr:hypothetical protein TRVL_08754 [Trypanosoma vivax]
MQELLCFSHMRLADLSAAIGSCMHEMGSNAAHLRHDSAYCGDSPSVFAFFAAASAAVPTYAVWEELPYADSHFKWQEVGAVLQQLLRASLDVEKTFREVLTGTFLSRRVLLLRNVMGARFVSPSQFVKPMTSEMSHASSAACREDIEALCEGDKCSHVFTWSGRLTTLSGAYEEFALPRSPWCVGLKLRQRLTVNAKHDAVLADPGLWTAVQCRLYPRRCEVFVTCWQLLRSMG